ncbi:MAG: polymerase sigma-70 factor [Candidatus Sulfotelmatobacter sp.]|nr:polymerase sigma-70 factor [Candidatus Sulfotelmatobacter sp.]
MLGPTNQMNASLTVRLSGLSTAANGQPETPNIREVTDEELMARLCQGDRDALSILFRRYARLVRGIALRILQDQSEADDLLQDLFLFIHRKAARFDGTKCAARSWIVQMTYHRALDRRRYLHSRHFYTRVDLDEATELLDHCVESAEKSNAASSLVGKTTTTGFLEALTEDQRNTLSLHFVEGFTFAEIATKLNQSLGNVRNHYYRGLEKLRKQMFTAGLPGHNRYGKK